MHVYVDSAIIVTRWVWIDEDDDDDDDVDVGEDGVQMVVVKRWRKRN